MKRLIPLLFLLGAPTLGGCEQLWRMVDKDVVALHDDKVAYMDEFRAEEEKFRLLLQEAEKRGDPELLEKAIASYLRASAGLTEGTHRCLRFVRENQSALKRSGLNGLNEAALVAEQAKLHERRVAYTAKLKQLQAAPHAGAKPEPAASR